MENSVFGRLPGEIRNKIYRLVLHEPFTIRFYVQQQNQQLAVIRSESLCPGRSPPLIEDCRPPLAISPFAVCRTMRRETFELYFGINCITIYASPGFRDTFKRFWEWLLSLKCHERKLVQRPQSITIWLGGFNPFRFPRWSRIRTAIGTFQHDILVRLVIRFSRSYCRGRYPESYEKFGLTEFTMFYSHLQDADRKLNQLTGQDREETSVGSSTVAVKLALGKFVGRMPTFRRRGDISKPFEVGLPSDLDAVYNPKLQKKHRGEEGLQMYDFVAEEFMPQDNFELSSPVKWGDRQAEKLACEEKLKQAMEQAVKQAIEQVSQEARIWSGERLTKGMSRRAIKDGAEQAADRAIRQVSFRGSQPVLDGGW